METRSTKRKDAEVQFLEGPLSKRTRAAYRSEGLELNRTSSDLAKPAVHQPKPSASQANRNVGSRSNTYQPQSSAQAAGSSAVPGLDQPARASAPAAAVAKPAQNAEANLRSDMDRSKGSNHAGRDDDDRVWNTNCVV